MRKTEVISQFLLAYRLQAFLLCLSLSHLHTALEHQELNGFKAEIMRLIRENAGLTGPQGEEDFKVTEDDQGASDMSDKVRA